MSQKLVITGCYWKEKCLPGLNDLLAEASRHPMAYNKLKKQCEMVIISQIRRQLGRYKAQNRVFPVYTFYEPKKGQKRDYDNVSAGGRKIVNDALVKAGVLQDDSPKYLLFGESKFVYSEKPGIVIELFEEGEDEWKEENTEKTQH